jgi:hypothetical protein
VKRPSDGRLSGDQTTRTPAMLSVVFENRPSRQSLYHFSQRNVLFDHLLMRMLADSKLSGLDLPTDPS